MYTNFLKSRTCYDIMPKSSKIVVFDTKLRVTNTSYIYALPSVPQINYNFTDWHNVIYVSVTKTG